MNEAIERRKIKTAEILDGLREGKKYKLDGRKIGQWRNKLYCLTSMGDYAWVSPERIKDVEELKKISVDII